LKCWIFNVKSIEIEQKRMSEEKKKQRNPAKKGFSILDGASEKTSKTANTPRAHETDDGGHQHGFVDQENSDYDSYGSGKKSHTRRGDSDIEF
jgi:hypothetical protein